VAQGRLREGAFLWGFVGKTSFVQLVFLARLWTQQKALNWGSDVQYIHGSTSERRASGQPEPQPPGQSEARSRAGGKQARQSEGAVGLAE